MLIGLLYVIAARRLTQANAFESLFDDLSKWMTDADGKYTALAASVPSTVDDAGHLLQECRAYRDELGKRQQDVDELASMVQRLRHGGIANARCLAQSNQINSHYSTLINKVKVTSSANI